MKAKISLRRFQKIHDIGCLPCRIRHGRYVEPQIHHVVEGYRVGKTQTEKDGNTYGNCPWHHQGYPKGGMTQKTMAMLFGPSMAIEPGKYRSEFGSERDLLAMQNRLLDAHEFGSCESGLINRVCKEADAGALQRKRES